MTATQGDVPGTAPRLSLRHLSPHLIAVAGLVISLFGFLQFRGLELERRAQETSWAAGAAAELVWATLGTQRVLAEAAREVQRAGGTGGSPNLVRLAQSAASAGGVLLQGRVVAGRLIGTDGADVQIALATLPGPAILRSGEGPPLIGHALPTAAGEGGTEAALLVAAVPLPTAGADLSGTAAALPTALHVGTHSLYMFDEAPPGSTIVHRPLAPGLELTLAVPPAGEDGLASAMLLAASLLATAGMFAWILTMRRRAVRLAGMAARLERLNADLAGRVRERDQFAETLRRSEARHRTVLERVSDVIFETDGAGRFLFVSAAWHRLTGRDPNQALGQELASFLPAGDAPGFRARVAAALAGDGGHLDEEVRLLDGGGRERLIRVAARTFRGTGDPAGCSGLIGTLTDVTEVKQAEAALRATEARYRTIFENANEGIYQSTVDGQFIAANPAFARILGYDSPAEMMAAVTDIAAQQYVDPAQRAGWISRLERDGSLVGWEHEVVRRDGSRIWVSESSRIVRGPDGTILHFEGSLEDISLRKQAETELRAAVERADMASRTKSEFLANMSHELRTPLNAIIGFSEIIKDQMFGTVGQPDYVDYASDIYESGRHLLNLINDILDVSKIEAGKRELNESVIDIEGVIATCVRLIRPRADVANLVITTEMPAGIPPVRAEELALKQVLLNLLSNAVKFTPDGGRIVVATRREADGLAIAIHDTGIGIASHDIPKVMAPFGQIDSALSRKTPGTGLGLTLVRSLVELHGGRFVLESELGRGTTATVFLPAARLLTQLAA